ncbi:MAG: DUF465 domain-containing protein [Acidobacteriota bacterium]|nr:DUF465 domain-containing protein [Blastocatellia bacterium]MDW8413157.1 DUF465 domain-containing protein [Acidobacteriota bacterium]
MSVSTADLKAELMKINPEFRELAKEHRRYEERLAQLAALHYPSQDEQTEETILKKKKLMVKDKMEAIIRNYKRTRNA